MRNDKKQIYSIRKFKIGVGSALIGIALVGGSELILPHHIASAHESAIEVVSSTNVADSRSTDDSKPKDINKPKENIETNDIRTNKPNDLVIDKDAKPNDERVDNPKPLATPPIPTRSEAVPNEGSTIPTNTTLRTASDVINKDEIFIGVTRADSGKDPNDLTGLNGETLNLSIDLNVSREDTIISDAKLVVESNLVKQDDYDTRYIVRNVSISGLNGESSLVERVLVDDTYETVRHTIPLGNLSTGSRMSLPVIVHSYSGFDDDQTHDIRYRLMSGDRVVYENKVTLRFDGYDIPKTGIELIPESYRHASLYGVDNLSSDNPGAILGEWETDLNKIGRRRSLYYSVKNLIDTTHGQLTSSSNNGAWDASHYRIRLTIPEHFEFESDARLSKVDYDAKGSVVDIHFPEFNYYKDLLKKRVGDSDESLTYGEYINDFRLNYTGTDKIDHVDVKWEVVDTRTNAPIDNLTTTYRHAVYFPDYKHTKPVKPVYGNDGFMVSNGLVINNEEVIKKYKSPHAAFSDNQSSTYKGYHTDQEEGATPLHDDIYKCRSIDDVYAVGGDNAISLKGDVVFTIEPDGINEHVSNLHKPFSKIMVDPVKLSNGEPLQDYTWTIDRIATSEEFDYKRDEEILDEDGFTTEYRIYDIEHHWRNARVYKENIQTSETTDVGTLGDLLTHRYTQNDYNADTHGMTDNLMKVRPNYTEPVYYYTKQPITLTNHERLVIDFGEHRAGDIKLYTSHHLQASDYEKITENHQTYTNDLSSYDGATIKPTLVRPVSFINNGKRFTHDYHEVKLVRFNLPKNHISPGGNISILKSVGGENIPMNFIDQSGVLSLDFSNDYRTHIHNEDQFGDVKYLVDLPTGINVSNWRIHHHLENGSIDQPINATVYKRVGDRIVYELMIPHDQRLKYGNKPQVSNPVNYIDVVADISYNTSIRPQNDSKSIDWTVRHGIMYQPLSSVIYERSEYGDPTDWNGDGKLDAYTNNDPLTGWVTHVMSELTTTLRLSEALFIRNINALGDQDLAIRDDVRPGGDVSFKTLIENHSGVNYRDVTVITVLPKVGDDLFDGSKDRGSTMNAILKEAVSPIDGWTVEYTTTPHLDRTHAKDLTGWVGADAIGDFSTVTAIRYKTQPNHIIRPGDVVSLPFTVTTPTNANIGDKFVSTSAIAFNGSSNYLEGYHAIATIYQPKGSVTVAYENENGERIHPDVTDLPNTTFAGTPYDTSEHALAHIRHQDKDYTLLKRKESSSPQNGEVTEGETRVVYVYKEGLEPVERTRRIKASATLIYTDTRGTPLKEAVSTGDIFIGTVTERVYPDRVEVVRYDTENANYDFTSNKLATIEVNGIMYHLQNDDLRLNGLIDQLFTENGFTGNPNITLRLIYDAERGSVVYRVLEKDTNKEIVSPQIYTNDAIVGTEYDLSRVYDLEAIRSVITTSQDGHYYRYSHHEGNIAGNVVKGETVVTVYVTPITGDVTVRYVDGDGKLIKTEMVPTVVNDDYDLTSLRLDTLTYNNRVYRLNRVEGNLTGNMTADTEGEGPAGVTNVTPHEKIVTIVYDVVKGDVEVKYTDTEGVEIKDKITPYDDVPIKSNYDVSNKKENTIEFGGKIYRYKETTGNTNGEVTENTTTITYVYDVVKGDVEVKYTDTEGVEIKDKITPYDDAPIKSNYDVSNKKEDTIEFGGKVYRYKETIGNTNGEVTENTTTVTYVYDVVKGNVEVKYVNTNGEEIKTKVIPYSDEAINTPYDVNNLKLNTIDFDNATYHYIHSTNNETGTITEEPTIIIYTYKKVGKTPYPFDPNTPDGPITPIPHVPNEPNTPVIPYVPGYEPETPLTPVNPDEPNKGYVPPIPTEIGEDTIIRYREVKGEIVVRHVDTNGNILTDDDIPYTNAKAESDYDVTHYKRSNIIKNGLVYKATGNVTGNLTGKISKGRTFIIFEYATSKVPSDYTTVDKPEVNIKVPNDYPTIEKPEANIKVPNDYPTVEKPEVNIKVPNNYPTVEKPEANIKVPNDYPTVEKPEANMKVPNDYPTVEKPEIDIKVPNSPQTLPNTGTTETSSMFGVVTLAIAGLLNRRKQSK